MTAPTALMDQFLPQWRPHPEELDRAPSPHGEWEYEADPAVGGIVMDSDVKALKYSGSHIQKARKLTPRKSVPKGTVVDPRIPELRIKSTGEIIDAHPLAARAYTDEEWRHKTRNELVEAIQRKNPIWVCPLCDVPVKLSSSWKGNYFFRHAVKEDGRCLYKTKEQLPDDVRAAKYNGAKESDAHKEMKGLLLQSLHSDPSFDPDSILEEKRWKGSSPWEWRQPDVQARRSDLRIAYEIQLSSTFIDEVVARREFYLRQGGILIWIFREVEKENPRLYQGDILFNNNGNLFVVDDETVSRSVSEQKLYLRNFHLIPNVSNGNNKPIWSEGELVAFQDLTFDLTTQRAFYFDYEMEVKRCLKFDLETRKEESRKRFFTFWLTHEPLQYRNEFESVEEEYITLARCMSSVGITLPSLTDDRSGFSYLSTFVYQMQSAMTGQPHGTKLSDLSAVWNNVYQHWKDFTWYFCILASQYKTMSYLRIQDREARTKRPTNKKGERIKTLDEKLGIVKDGLADEYRPSPHLASIAAFLYPDTPRFAELAEGLEHDPSHRAGS